MIHIYYITAILILCAFTFCLTRRHYYRPSAPLPAQINTNPITTIATPIDPNLETPQESINKLVDALDVNTKTKNKSMPPKSWLGMN